MKSRNLFVACAAALALAASSAAVAQQAPPAGGRMEMKATGTPGTVAGGRKLVITAKVKALDVASREITLEGAKGRTQTFHLGSDVKNLDQVKVGDTVTLEYVQGLMMKMQAPGEAPVEPQAAIAAGRAEPGQSPGAAAAAEIRATVTITAIDPKTRMVVFEGPSGNLYQVKAGPDVHLEKAKVGDKLVATYAEAMAVTVKPAKKAAAKAKKP